MKIFIVTGKIRSYRLHPDASVCIKIIWKPVPLSRSRWGRRLVNLMTAWKHEIKELMGGMGINSIEALRGNRLMLRGIGLTDKELEILGISHAGK